MKQEIDKAIEEYRTSVQEANHAHIQGASDEKMKPLLGAVENGLRQVVSLINAYAANVEDYEPPTIGRVQVESSSISSVRYDADALALEVTFKNRKGVETETGILFNVTQDLYDRFINSDSKGKFYREHFYKSEKYPYQKVG